MAIFSLPSVLPQGTAWFPGPAPTSAGHTDVCHSHRKIQPWGSSALSPHSGLNLWFIGGRERCPPSQAVLWDVAGRGELLGAGFVFKGVPGHVAGSLVVPAVPSKSTPGTGCAQAQR